MKLNQILRCDVQRFAASMKRQDRLQGQLVLGVIGVRKAHKYAGIEKNGHYS